jgi:glycosyltransferase involved in cell wall biosynthesis
VTGPPAGDRPIHVLLPQGVDDPARPSGGNVYDLRVCAELEAAGRSVSAIAVRGDWPHPSPRDEGALADALARVPTGDVVLLDGLVGCAAPGALEAHSRRLRLAVLVHLPLADETGLPPATAAALDVAERRALHAAGVVVATSEAVGRRLVEHHGVGPDRVRLAPPGADQAPVTDPTEAGGRLLCVASVTPRKGHDALIEALARVGDLGWELLCVGPLDRDPPFVAGLRSRIAALGIADRVRFAGPRPPADLDEAYADADLLVLASRAEPYGMVVTEALARGVPVLASAVDGVPEALGTAPDGTLPGLLVPPGDPAALAAALRWWLTDEGVRAGRRTAAAARRARLRSWSETAAALAAALDGSSDRPSDIAAHRVPAREIR